MIRFLTFLLLIMLTYGTLCAQSVGGVAVDVGGKPLAGASIVLKKSKDSSVIKLAISNGTGQYEFTSLPSGNYFVNISQIGYTPRNSSPFSVLEGEPARAPSIPLSRPSAALLKAIVTSRHPISLLTSYTI